MAVRAVIFDWGGTLTPWHSIDLGELWLAVCARHYPAEEAAAPTIRWPTPPADEPGGDS